MQNQKQQQTTSFLPSSFNTTRRIANPKSILDNYQYGPSFRGQNFHFKTSLDPDSSLTHGRASSLRHLRIFKDEDISAVPNLQRSASKYLKYISKPNVNIHKDIFLGYDQLESKANEFDIQKQMRL